jgi:hypothetical protein
MFHMLRILNLHHTLGNVTFLTTLQMVNNNSELHIVQDIVLSTRELCIHTQMQIIHFTF